jgi:hypothetical protein
MAAAAAVTQVACSGAAISTLVVDLSNWSDPTWRIQYLCAQARLGLHYLHDEPWPQNRRRIYFASF